MFYNLKVSKAIKQIEERVDSAKNEDDLVAILDAVISEKLPVKYDQRLALFLFFISTVNLVYWIVLYARTSQNNDFTLISLVPFCFFAFLIAIRWGNVYEISKKLFRQDIWFNNGLTPEKVNGDKLAKQLRKSFKEFHRGNYSQEIEFIAKGVFNGSEHTFNYDVMTFLYIDLKSGGKTTYKEYYRRYGIVFDFPYSTSLLVSQDLPERYYDTKYQDASVSFTKQYKVRCENVELAARFLKPAVIDKFTTFMDKFKEIHFEINETGEACLFVEDKLLKLENQYGIDKPEKFKEEILQHNKLHALDDVLQFAHYLMTQADNNFRKGK